MGFVLPRGVVQPFEILFSRDDLHVIINLADHPVYEAVEAMIRLGPGARRVRAIITRRDQTQIDQGAVSPPARVPSRPVPARRSLPQAGAARNMTKGCHATVAG